MEQLTDRQKEYLKFMRDFFDKNDQLPPIKILADGMGVTNNAASDALTRLIRAGEIQRNSLGKWMFAR
jgi:Mn-dependent DtxR family transcriptional regulator